MARLLRPGDYRSVPWKNGGGVTREIAVEHAPEGRGDFLWRLSIATVSQAGPFSTFPGIDRTIAVLSGNGIALDLSGEVTRLTTSAEPFRFKGENAVLGDVIDGETTDLNVMTLRSAASHMMRRLHVTDRATVRCEAGVTAIVANSTLRVHAAGTAFELDTLDTLLDIDPGTELVMESVGGGEVFIIEIDRH